MISLCPFCLQVSVDTACSSALVATHMAAQQLAKRSGAALAAGVNLMLAEHTTAATLIAGKGRTLRVLPLGTLLFTKQME